jgi:retron-type reverse transcriptase
VQIRGVFSFEVLLLVIIRWINSFFIDRKVQLVINGYICSLKEVEADLSQGSLISPILFVIYISGFFDYIEEKILITILLFVNNINIIAVESFTRDTTKTLEVIGLETI